MRVGVLLVLSGCGRIGFDVDSDVEPVTIMVSERPGSDIASATFDTFIDFDTLGSDRSVAPLR